MPITPGLWPLSRQPTRWDGLGGSARTSLAALLAPDQRVIPNPRCCQMTPRQRRRKKMSLGARWANSSTRWASPIIPTLVSLDFTCMNRRPFRGKSPAENQGPLSGQHDKILQTFLDFTTTPPPPALAVRAPLPGIQPPPRTRSQRIIGAERSRQKNPRRPSSLEKASNLVSDYP